VMKTHPDLPGGCGGCCGFGGCFGGLGGGGGGIMCIASPSSEKEFSLVTRYSHG